MSFNKLPDIPYTYRNAPIPGGGFVTGFVFHPRVSGILYARTDIGGVYRYDFVKREWRSLMDHVTHMGKWESYPLSIAVDENNPDRLYIAAGDARTSNYLCRSEDRGAHFTYFPIPAGIHGNASGRGTGERLVVDPHDGNILYFGSQTEGLLVSEDRGETWRKLAVKPDGGNNETNIAFVWLDMRSGGGDGNRCRTIVVSTSGQCNTPDGKTRGKSLYISFDGGAHFMAMPGQPEPPEVGNQPGFVGQRAAFENGRLYITMASVIYSWRGFDGYACDMGGAQVGCVLRYDIPEIAGTIGYRFVTPKTPYQYKENVDFAHCGFGGICADINHPGRLVCTIQGSPEDAVLITHDSGENWRVILQGLETGEMRFTVPYMKPVYNGGGNLIHWLSDIKINPFDSNHALFNTGTGIFMTENLMEAAEGGISIWSPACTGLEETVHLNVYSPTAGDKHLIDIVGDLGGFAFADLTQPAENSFADAQGNRYITCLNADFPDDNPSLVVVTARGNWKGYTTGGLIVSEDQCETWTRLDDPTDISEEIDRLVAAIRKPNTNSGWTAVSSDGGTIIWCLANGNILPSDAVVYTDDRGKTWAKVAIMDRYGKPVTGQTLKVIADRILPNRFYGFGDDSHFYVSENRGRLFNEIPVPDAFPRLLLGGIDGRMPAEIRAESGKSTIWVATGAGGLWRVDYPAEAPLVPIFKRVTAEGDSVFRQGMGKPLVEGAPKTLYVNGIFANEYGFWRSADEGVSFYRINTNRQMYGDIRSITGDPRIAGRVYIATGSRGVLWGDPVIN